ncbi:hypothetical protein AMTRI_Chr13g85590 [Amborella trichopoda]
MREKIDGACLITGNTFPIIDFDKKRKKSQPLACNGQPLFFLPRLQPSSHLCPKISWPLSSQQLAARLQQSASLLPSSPATTSLSSSFLQQQASQLPATF